MCICICICICIMYIYIYITICISSATFWDRNWDIMCFSPAASAHFDHLRSHKANGFSASPAAKPQERQQPRTVRVKKHGNPLEIWGFIIIYHDSSWFIMICPDVSMIIFLIHDGLHPINWIWVIIKCRFMLESCEMDQTFHGKRMENVWKARRGRRSPGQPPRCRKGISARTWATWKKSYGKFIGQSGKCLRYMYICNL